MDETEFARLAAAHGGDIARWPERFRGEALHLAQSSDNARRILAAELEIDALLSLQPSVAPDRVGRSIAAVTTRLSAERRFNPFRWLGRLAAPVGLVAASVMGIMIGWTAPSAPTADASLADLLAVTMSYSDSALFSHTKG
jgi:hypothetical protein